MLCPSFIVIENFYEDPDKVRAYALQQKYVYENQHYPGKRSINMYYTETIHNTLKRILAPYYSNIKINKGSSHGEFQITNKNDKSWIHQDKIEIDMSKTIIVGICYLTPNAPLDSGTIFFEKNYNNEYLQSDIINNKYNRLILFNGDLHHISGKYFGSTDNDSRLTQVFFLECS